NKVIAYHQLKNIEPSKESVRATLSSFEERGLKKILTPKELIALVAKFYGIDLDDILGKSREKRLSFPRQIAMHLLREEIKLSYPAIGQELGGRDHTTAMHAHTKIKKLLHTDAKLREEVELIKQQAKSPQ
ncbi:MAG: chromosomal replication initiator protein DnaA, partial [Candidatus Magasanikbacteria bacterium]|nr:chromosomal replication initiator protein DnaA [Candidatus Magasanikbacteria bacterium]